MQNISIFCDYLSHQKRYSKHTITAYKKDLEQFQLFLDKEYEITQAKQVTSLIIRSWIVHLIEGGINTRSINRKLSTLKSFFKYLLKNELVKNNPLLKVTAPKTSKRLPVFVGENEMNNLFENISFNNDFEGLRDQLILELFYSSGIRLSELIELQLNSSDKHNNTIRVIGKRNKERIIPLAKNVNSIFTQYLLIRKEVNPSNNYIFLTKKGEKIYPKLVYRIVNHYLSMVTTTSKKSPHVLRHTFATHMLNNGADLNSIKELLGHANLSATQVYTHNTIEKLKNIHKQAHPKA
ncbi:MAG: tyrosine recombinase XerC [Vicingus serpentipes]|nr:tyrosine recombinase XerC [Vicingus serpentipes]